MVGNKGAKGELEAEQYRRVGRSVTEGQKAETWQYRSAKQKSIFMLSTFRNMFFIHGHPLLRFCPWRNSGAKTCHAEACEGSAGAKVGDKRD